MQFVFPSELFSLLREVVEKRCPDSIHLLAGGTNLELTDDQRRRFEDAALEEFLAELGPDDEPTARGRRLNDLVSAFAPYTQELFRKRGMLKGMDKKTCQDEFSGE